MSEETEKWGCEECDEYYCDWDSEPQCDFNRVGPYSEGAEIIEKMTSCPKKNCITCSGDGEVNNCSACGKDVASCRLTERPKNCIRGECPDCLGTGKKVSGNVKS